MFTKIKSFLTAAIFTAAYSSAYLAVPAVIAIAPVETASAAECSQYETIHPNFPLTGSHMSTGKCSTCASCHAGGHFLGTPKVCATCHASGNPFTAAYYSPQHIPIGITNCDACHTTTDFKTNWMMQHSTVSNEPCTTCHNGNYNSYGAMPKPQNHVPTTAECGSCHTPKDTGSLVHDNSDWFVAMDVIHAGIITGCVSCHDGNHQPAMGKINYAPGHPQTSDACETCHSINNTFKCASLINDKYIREMMSKKLFS